MSNVLDGVDNDLQGIISNLSRKRNLSLTKTLNLMLRIAVKDIPETTEIEKAMMQREIIYSELESACMGYFTFPKTNIADLFCFVKLSIPPILVYKHEKIILEVWEQSILKTLFRIELFDRDSFEKIRKTLRQQKDFWLHYAEFKVEHRTL